MSPIVATAQNQELVMQYTNTPHFQQRYQRRCWTAPASTSHCTASLSNRKLPRQLSIKGSFASPIINSISSMIQLDKKNTSILQWNARSFRGKKVELSIINIIKNYDIILLTETWLKVNEPFHINNYNIVRKDWANHNSSGLTIAIKTNLTYEILEDIFELKDQIDTLAIRVNTDLDPIVSDYVSPHTKIRKGIWESLLSISIQNKFFMIAKGFNIHHTTWGSYKNTTQGNEMTFWK